MAIGGVKLVGGAPPVVATPYTCVFRHFWCTGGVKSAPFGALLIKLLKCYFHSLPAHSDPDSMERRGNGLP